MPKTNTRERSNDGETTKVAPSLASVVTVANATSVPLPFEQFVSDMPTGQFTGTLPARVKLTRKSISMSIKRNAILGSFWLNLPFIDGLMSVAKIYKQISTLAFNYQAKHQDAFFEAYPDLLIFKENEDPATFTTSVLRRQYKEFSKRIAHYYYHYIEGRKLVAGALANLIGLTRLNGNEVTKKIAYDIRWSKINTATNLFQRFPQGRGTDDYIINNSHYATGKTTFGADIVCYYQWIVDIYGNRGSHAEWLDKLVSTDSDGVIKELLLNPSESADNIPTIPHNHAVISEMTIAEHGWGTPLFETRAKTTPCMPIVENGTTVAAQVSAECSARLNWDGNVKYPTVNGCTSQLTAKTWNNYFYWQDYLTAFFSDMMDPNNDKYTFAMQQLKIIEPSKTPEDFLTGIRNANAWNMSDIATHVSFMNGNAANTATILKIKPFLLNKDESGDTSWRPTHAAVFADNFEMYDVESSNIPEMIENSKIYPKIAPVVYGDRWTATRQEGVVNNLPFVLNAIPTPSVEVSLEGEGSAQGIKAPIGKYASLLDLAKSGQASADLTRIQGLGIDKDWFDKWVSSSGAFTFEEDPTTPIVAQQPLFDTSDPFQLGFNLMVASDDPNPNEWVKAVISPDNYTCYDSTGQLIHLSEDNVLKEIDTINTKNSKYAPSEPAVTMQSSGGEVYYSRAHLANPEYRDMQEHAFVFLGIGIFSHPWMTVTMLGSLRPAQLFNLSQTDDYNAAIRKFLHSEAIDGVQSGVAEACSDFYQQLSRAGAYECVDEYSSYADQSSMEWLLSQAHDAATGVMLRCYTYAPDYPQPIPSVGGLPFANCVPFSIDAERSSYVPDSAAISPKFGCISIGSKSGATSNAMIYSERAVWMADATPPEWWVYWLESLQLPREAIENGAVVLVSDEDSAPIAVFASKAKYAFALTAIVISEFAGINKASPFWASLGDASCAFNNTSPSLGSGNIPENNVMALPRAPRATRSPSHSFQNMRDGSSPNLKGETSYVGFSKSDELTGDKPWHGKHHRAKRRSSKHTFDKADGYDQKNDAEGSVITAPEGVKSTDITADKVDKKVESQIRKPIDVVALQQ